MKKEVIIVAGGQGQRMHSALPKQFLLLGGKPILMHSIECFFCYDSSIHIVLVLPENQLGYWEELKSAYQFNIPHDVVTGGNERFFSVQNGLTHISGNSLVAVHDGVRPFVSDETLHRCFDGAEKYGNAVPCCKVNDSMRQVTQQKNCAVDRSVFRVIQTPQVFRSDILVKAYEQDFSARFTDDASVVEILGENIHLVDGNIENIKITTTFDLLVGEALIKSP